MGSKQVVSGVTVTWNDAKHPKFNVKDGPLNKSIIPRSKNNDDEFIPSRIVVDLKLNLGDATVSKVVLSDVHLLISYSGAAPTIGWWNGAKWVKFKQEQLAYANNVADVTLPSPWPTDPAIGTYP